MKKLQELLVVKENLEKAMKRDENKKWKVDGKTLINYRRKMITVVSKFVLLIFISTYC